jgi:hypothetical protein
MVRGKAMADKSADMLDIMRDILLDAKLNNQERFKQVCTISGILRPPGGAWHRRPAIGKVDRLSSMPQGKARWFDGMIQLSCMLTVVFEDLRVCAQRVVHPLLGVLPCLHSALPLPPSKT